MSAAALQRVLRGVAEDDVVARAADRGFDQGSRVALVLQRVVDVSPREMAVAEPGRLHVGELGGAAGGQVDLEVGGVVRQIVGVVAAAVPDRHEDAVGAGIEAQLAIDVGLAGVAAPSVGRGGGVRREIGAVHLLERADVAHHEGLGHAEELVGIFAHRRADVGAEGHHRGLQRVPGRGDRAPAVRVVSVLEAQRVARHHQDGVVVAGPLDREPPRAAEEGVAAAHVAGGRHEGIGRSRIGGIGEAQDRVADRAGPVGEVRGREGLDREPAGAGAARDGGVLVEGVLHGAQLVGGQARRREDRKRVVGAVVRGRVRIAVGDLARAPAPADQAVDAGVADAVGVVADADVDAGFDGGAGGGTQGGVRKAERVRRLVNGHDDLD